MKLFLDSANLEEIKSVSEMGILGGITTNPTLLVKHLSDTKETQKYLKQICDIAQVDVLAEPVSTDADGIFTESIELSKISEHIVAKIPLTGEGLIAVKKLKERKVKTAFTLIFSLSQALTAGIAGVDYICPFVGRLDDIGKNGMELIRQIVQIYRNYNFKTKVIVASVRNINHIVESALTGADAITIPYKLLQEVLHHELTDAGIKKFLDDWSKIKKTL